MKSKCCDKISFSDKDRREDVLWLHDVYVYPVYAPDQGPPKSLRPYMKSWTELLGTLTTFLCTISMLVTYFCHITWMELKTFSKKTGLIHYHLRLHQRCYEHYEKVDNMTDLVMRCSSWPSLLLENDLPSGNQAQDVHF